MSEWKKIKRKHLNKLVLLLIQTELERELEDVFGKLSKNETTEGEMFFRDSRKAGGISSDFEVIQEQIDECLASVEPLEVDEE